MKWTWRDFVFDNLSDSTGSWCGTRGLSLLGGFVVIGAFLTGHCTVAELVYGVSGMAAVYAGKDWSERH